MSIRIVGIGGCGRNAVARLLRRGIPGISCVVMDTDDRARLDGAEFLLLGRNVLGGRGANGDRAAGQRAAEASKGTIEATLAGAETVITLSGFAGGTGSGCVPTVIECAKRRGATCVCLGYTPNAFEGKAKRANAEWALGQVRQAADAYMTVSNESMFGLARGKTPMADVFEALDADFADLVEAIARLQSLEPGPAKRSETMDCFRAGRRLSVAKVQGLPEQIVDAPGSRWMEPHAGCEALLVLIAVGGDVPRRESRRLQEWVRSALPGTASVIATGGPALGSEVSVTSIGFHRGER